MNRDTLKEAIQSVVREEVEKVKYGRVCLKECVFILITS